MICICAIQAHNFCKASSIAGTAMTKLNLILNLTNRQRWHHRCHANLAFRQTDSTSNRLQYTRSERSNFTWHGCISSQNKGKQENGFAIWTFIDSIYWNRDCIWTCWPVKPSGMSDWTINMAPVTVLVTSWMFTRDQWALAVFVSISTIRDFKRTCSSRMVCEKHLDFCVSHH